MHGLLAVAALRGSMFTQEALQGSCACPDVLLALRQVVLALPTALPVTWQNVNWTPISIALVVLVALAAFYGGGHHAKSHTLANNNPAVSFGCSKPRSHGEQVVVSCPDQLAPPPCGCCMLPCAACANKTA